MTLDSLLTVLPPPYSPVETATPDGWGDIESQLGKLPDDYRVFVEYYGSGTIDGFLWILNPFSHNRHGNLLAAIEPILSALRELRDGGESSPYPLHPEANGLLPFGKTDNGDAVFWQTLGKPDKWPVVVNAARESDYQKFECNMTEFLTGLLTRRLHCSIFPDGFPSQNPVFTTTPMQRIL